MSSVDLLGSKVTTLTLDSPKSGKTDFHLFDKEGSSVASTGIVSSG